MSDQNVLHTFFGFHKEMCNSGFMLQLFIKCVIWFFDSFLDEQNNLYSQYCIKFSMLFKGIPTHGMDG